MEIIRNLELTANEFFDCLFQDTIDDIVKNSKKELKKDNIKKGYKFVYQGEDAYSRITFEVVDYQENTYYKVKRSSINGTVIVSYNVVPTDKGISVTLNQTLLKNGKEVVFKGLFGKLSEAIYLGRMSDNLYNIQKKVYNAKNGIVETKMQPLFAPKPKK